MTDGRSESGGGTADNSTQIGPVAMEIDPIEREEAKIFARLGGHAVPIIVVHAALIYVVIKAATGFTLSPWLYSWPVAMWLCLNGAALGYGVWMWRKNRFSPDARRWVTGRGARTVIAIWLATPLLLFLLPWVLGDMWRVVRPWLSGW